MELRQLRYFVAAAEERHFTRAAARCHVAQSGLSATIKALENELGTQLLHRTTRRVELTEAGRLLLPAARATLQAAESAEQAIVALGRELAGPLDVGIMQVHGSGSLAPVLARFHQAHPHVQISLRQAGAARLVEDLRQGDLDVAFLALATGPPPDLDCSRLATYPLVAACPEDCGSTISLRTLVTRPFIDFPADWSIRAAVERELDRQQIERTVAYEVNDIATALDFVAAGLGVTIIPRPQRPLPEGVTLRTLTGSRLALTDYVAVRAAPLATRAAMELASMAAA